MDYLANGEFCANNGDERCPAAVDGVIRQGLPVLAAAAAQRYLFKLVKHLSCIWYYGVLVVLIMQKIVNIFQACNAGVPGTCPEKETNFL